MAKPHRLYVGTIGEGLFRSLDGGETFTRTCDGMFVECHVRALVVHPRDPKTLFLGNELGLFKTCDGADHWSQIESPLDGKQVWSILVMPNDPDVILVGTCPSRIFRSAEGGRTWEEPKVELRQDCPRIISTRVTTLSADPTAPGTVWCGVEIDGLRRSRDAGKTWEKVGAGLSSQDIHSVAVIPGEPEAIPGEPEASAPGGKKLLATTNNDLNVSTDDGATWKPQGIGKVLPWPYCRGLALPVGRPGVVLLGNGDAPPGCVGLIARSTDGGATWQPAKMPGRSNSTMWNFATHPADPELVYASSVSGQVYQSSDAGASWNKLPREFGEIRALAWTP